MKTETIAGVAVMAVALGAAGCSHAPAEKKLDERMAQESQVQSRAELARQADSLIESSKDLSADQKAKLTSLRDSTRTQLDRLQKNSLELRSVLIRDVVSKDFDEREVELIKKRMRSIENQRLSVIFGAVTRANEILGRQAAVSKSEILHDIFVPTHSSE